MGGKAIFVCDLFQGSRLEKVAWNNEPKERKILMVHEISRLDRMARLDGWMGHCVERASWEAKIVFVIDAAIRNSRYTGNTSNTKPKWYV
jgi:hypothetical protein